MDTCGRMSSRLLCSAISTCLLCNVYLAVSRAQVTLDGSFGSPGRLSGPAYHIPHTSGLRRGPNLFHSFGEFSLRHGESATFTGPQTIQNILSRVTGGQPSQIDGTLRSAIPGANLFLLNPYGVVFGPNARLEVNGSFHVSTADYLRLADEARFSAHLGERSTFTVAPPVAFGFLGPTPASITVQRSALEVPQGATLSLIGGDIAITGDPALTNPSPPSRITPTLRAAGGRLQLASVASAGEVSVNLADHGTNAPFGSFTRLGQITIAPDSILDVSAFGAGTVAIRGGRLVMDNATLISQTLGAVDGGGVDIVVESAILTDGSVISSSTFGSGQGGTISVTATDEIMITGRRASDNRRSSLLNFSVGLGDAGDITLSAPRISLDDGVLILASFIAFLGQTGNAGNIVINAGRFTLTGGSVIDNSPFPLPGIPSSGIGQGGLITITATDAVVIAGRDRFPSPTGLFLPSSIFNTTNSNRNAGSITLTTPLLLMNDSLIGASTFGSGRGGDIIVDVGTLRLLGGARIDSGSRPPNRYSATTGTGGTVRVTASDEIFIAGRASNGLPSSLSTISEGRGNGGGILVTTPRLTLQDHGSIETRSIATGQGGDIQLRAQDVRLTDQARISAESAQADGGSIRITAQSLLSLRDSTITATVNGGRETVGGNVSINAGFIAAANSQIIANASAGQGGTVRIQAGVFLEDPASRVSASSTLGIDGLVDIQAPVTEVSGRLTPLPQTFASPVELRYEKCAARLWEGQLSSLVTRGRDGVPASPGGVLPSPFYEAVPGIPERLETATDPIAASQRGSAYVDQHGALQIRHWPAAGFAQASRALECLKQ